MPINFDNVQELPLTGGLTFQEFDTVLDGTPFTIRQRWNTRDAAWFIDLLDVNGGEIFIGAKIVIGNAIGRRVTDPRLPGLFLADDLGAGQNNPRRDATFDDIGTRVRLYFYPFSEWFSTP